MVTKKQDALVWPQIDDRVEITFWDHTSNSNQLGASALEFVTYGRVSHIDEVAIIIATWEYTNHSHRQSGDSNEGAYAIVKGAITEIKKLT